MNNYLKLTDTQYQIRHESIKDFKIGDRVFLKSNPEIEMEVCEFDYDNNLVITKWKNTKIDIHNYGEFKPETIIQYDYASLICIREKYNICLN